MVMNNNNVKCACGSEICKGFIGAEKKSEASKKKKWTLIRLAPQLHLIINLR